MFLYTLRLVAALLGIFAIVPGVVLISTQSMREAWEATKGYAIVVSLLFVGPGLIGCVIALVSMPFID